MVIKKTQTVPARGSIIISDADEQLCETLRNFFTDEGYGVWICSDFDEFMTLNHSNLKVILIDVSYSNPNAIHIIELIKQNSVGSITPLIITADMSSTSNIVEGLNAGADDYILKPFTCPELLARVNAITRVPLRNNR